MCIYLPSLIRKHLGQFNKSYVLTYHGIAGIQKNLVVPCLLYLIF